MQLRLRRLYQKDDYTIGPLYINGQYFCDILEDSVRDLNKDGDLLDEGEGKIPSKTAIPYGSYDIILSMSPKFGRVLPLLLNVKHFEGVRIHRGRTAANSAGCLIPGENKKPGEVINSAKYEQELIALILDAVYHNESIWIVIT